MICPFCGGGGSHERSLSIKRDAESGLILYHCFRANCGESGVLGGSRIIRIIQNLPRAFEPWDSTGVVPIIHRDTPVGVREQLREWGFHEEPIDWSYDPRDDRILMPIRGPMYDLRGYVRRAYRAGQRPKVLMGRVRDDVPMVAYLWHTLAGGVRVDWNRTVVAVEDIPSATRLQQEGVEAIAFLGCTPSDDVLDEIGRTLRTQSKGLCIALDADASAQAMRVMRAYGMRGDCSVKFLDKDVKNMTEQELDQWLASGV